MTIPDGGNNHNKLYMVLATKRTEIKFDKYPRMMRFDRIINQFYTIIATV